jgi:hypothetical protein
LSHKATARVRPYFQEKLKMNLSSEDAALFFKLMWAVQFYVNSRLKLVEQVASAEVYKTLPQEEKMKVREALYQHSELLDDFIAANPANLTPAELEIVHNWKQFVAGDFYIMKFLKKHAIFLPAKGESSYAYAVLGLFDPLEDIFYGHPLPILVKAVLLPFKGRIIYDGLFQGYASIFFGPGIRGSLNEAYQRAKQNGRIIESLEPEQAAAKPPRRPKVGPDWRPTLDEIVQTTEKLRQAETVIQTKAFGLLKNSAKLAQAAVHNPDNLDDLYKLVRRTETALNQLVTALDRAEWD